MWDLIVVLGQSVVGQKVFQPTKVLSWWVRLHLEGVSSKLKYARKLSVLPFISMLFCAFGMKRTVLCNVGTSPRKLGTYPTYEKIPKE